MIRWLRAASLILVLLQARAALAQDAKIAVVNLQRLTTASDEGKKALEKVEKRYQEITVEMQKLSRAIEEKETALRKQELAISAARRDQILREIDTDKRTLGRKNEDYQRELAEMEQQVMGPIVAQAEAILAAYIKERNFTLVINSAAENGNLVWFNPANDVTEEVIKLINAQVKSAPPAATTPAAAAPPKPASPTPLPAADR
jgi:outer membrane protein